MNRNIALFASPVAAQNITLFLNTFVNMEQESALRLLRTCATCAFMGLAEICIRNPQRTEGLEVGFSRRDRTKGFELVEKFLAGDPLSLYDCEAACELAYRYRKQILRFIPSAPEVTIEETENAF